VTILDAPTWTSLVDAAAVGGDTLTATVVRNSSGHAVRVYTRLDGATSWTLSGTVASGTGSSSGSLTIASLTTGKVYEAVLVSYSSPDVSIPSTPLRAIPTTGTGSIPERAVANIMAAVETITTANGYYASVAAVFRGGPEPLKAVGYPHAFVQVGDGSCVDFATVGGQGLTEDRLPVTVWLVQRAHGDESYPQEEAIRAHNAIVRAVMADPYRASTAVDTIPTRWSPFCSTDDSPTAGVAVSFDVLLRYARDNPTLLIPT